jgi:hypothetical protein
MKTKNITFILVLSSLMASESCSGMSYIRNWYNSLTATKSEQNSPNMFQRFMYRCRKVGVLPTISAAFGIYNFKTMSGLDYNALDSYNAEQLENAQNLVGERIEDLGHSQKLEDMFMLIQKKKFDALSRAEMSAAEYQ